MERIPKALSVGLVVASCFLFARASTHAELVYFDNFEQFPNGTTLIPTNYVPASGPSGASASFNFGFGHFGVPPTVMASNSFGSTKAFFDFSTGRGDSLYTCSLAVPQANQILMETWTLWVEDRPGGRVSSGFDVMLPATNGTMQSVLEFSDIGQVFALNTNSDVNSFNFIGIGKWRDLADTLMTNQLIVNYPANTFSFSLNGIMLANLPLCGLFTNLVGQTGFDASEQFPGPSARQFALDDVMVETMQVPEPATLGMVILGTVTLLAIRQSRRSSP